MGVTQKISDFIFGKRPTFKVFSPATKEENISIDALCKEIVKDGRLKKVFEEAVSKSEARQLEASKRPLMTTEAEFEYHFRNGIGNVWDMISKRANNMKPKEDFDAYSII